MKTKLRENFAAKALAFAVAVAAFTASAMMVWYQAANFDVLWGDAGPTGSVEARRLMYEEQDSIEQLLELKGRQRAGETLSGYEEHLLEGLENAYSAQNTNLRWQLLSHDGSQVLAGNTQDDAQYQRHRWRYDLNCGGYWGEYKYYLPVYMWVDESLPVDDAYRAAALDLEQWRMDRELYLAFTVLLAADGLALTIFLCVGTGHRRGVPGIYLNGFHRLPGDVVLVAAIMPLCMLIGMGLTDLLIRGLYAYSYSLSFQLWLGSLLVAVTVAVCLALLVTFAARYKAHTLLRNTLIWKVCAWCWRLLWSAIGMVGHALDAVPLIWKAVLGFGAYGLFTVWVIFNCWYSIGLLLMWLVVSVVVLFYVLVWAYQWKRIRQGTQEIIGGNPDYHIDTRQMLPDLRAHAGELNNLGQAISAAVEDRMTSERFKAELITNVSHDLKTPLTSIINYVDLLKKEQIDNPRAVEYIEVLDRKSQRLKKLTEDLVEASKASTGNLAVNLDRLDFKQLIDQALAECGERLAEHGLTVVRTLPEGPVWVEADGRHLWRVLDNLLTNCAKYALENTRVYVELREGGSQAMLCVKNISRDPLDIPAERLVERFVRGDESRTAQGSGLGLSIAQSLTELQNGRFDISIDGDLFKAMVTLPLAGGEPASAPDLISQFFRPE